MKKESIVYIVITLVVVVLVGVIVINAKKNVSSNSATPSQAAPAVNVQQQISMLEEILAKDPNNRDAWVNLGHKYFDSDQPMKAITTYDKALELKRNDPNVLTDQGVMFRRLGWFDKALSNFEEASRIAPNHQQSFYNQGIVYRYDLQDFPKAKAAWERFLAINPAGPGADQVRAELSHPAMSTPK